MAYEKEAIVDTTAATPTPLPQIIREDRVIDPYAQPKRMAKAVESIGQQNTDGAPSAADPAKPAETVRLSPQVAALARKEQKFRQDEARLKSEREALAKDKEEIAELKAMRDKLKAKDYSALDGVVDYNEYSKYELDKLNGTDPNQEAIKALNEKIANLEKNQEEQTSKLFDAAVAERKNAALKLLNADPAFSTFKAKMDKSMPQVKLEEAITQHILDTWENDSEELSVEQAADEVRSVLLEKAKRWAGLLEEPQKPQDPQPDAKKPLPALNKPGIKTLTQHVTTGESNSPKKSFRGMSDAERWAEARRRAEAKLQLKQG